jgi:hypothetical protein
MRKLAEEILQALLLEMLRALQLEMLRALGLKQVTDSNHDSMNKTSMGMKWMLL